MDTKQDKDRLNVYPRFALKRIGAARPTSITMRIKYQGNQMNLGTGLTVWSDLFDPVEKRPYTKSSMIGRSVIPQYTKRDPHIPAKLEQVSNRLDQIELQVIEYFGQFTVANPPTKEAAKREITRLVKSINNPGSVSGSGKENTLGAFVDRYIREMTNGDRLTEKGTRYADTSIKAYRSFVMHLVNYQREKHTVIGFDDVTLEFHGKFSAYLAAKGINPSTQNKYIKSLKATMAAASDLKLHTNQEFRSRRFGVSSQPSEFIYLRQNEVNALAALQLTGYEEKVRDLFLIQLYSAQRFSDAVRIAPEHIKRTSAGVRVLQISQQKTGKRVVVPIMPEFMALLKKHGRRSPQVTEQHVNRTIKQLAERAGITEPTQIAKTIKGKRVHITVPKCSLITTHTARRSGATLMYQSGIPLVAISRITGHSNLKQLQSYIKITSEESADTLSMHPYFNKMRAVK